MPTMMIDVDARTESRLREMSTLEGSDVSKVAARLLARAVRAARPRPTYDAEALKAVYAEFADEDIALAESGLKERACLLAEEDAV